MSGPRRFVINVDGHRLEVAVKPARDDGPVEVTVDGHTRWVSEAAGGDQLVRADECGPQVRVTLPDGATPRWAATPTASHTLHVRTARQAAHDDAAAEASAGTSGSASIEAPMPGRVVKVMVEDGEWVEDNAALLIIEAMKMENEVRAPVAGRVTQLSVDAGATVEPGQVLCVLDPESDTDTDTDTDTA